jgi:hypothetical protein
MENVGKDVANKKVEPEPSPVPYRAYCMNKKS